MSSPALDRSGGLYRPPSQRKPSATLGKPSPTAKSGTRTPRGPPSRANAPPTPVTPSPFKARSRPASAAERQPSASGSTTPNEPATEPESEAADAPKIIEAPNSLAASTDTLVGAKSPKDVDEAPEIKEISANEDDAPAADAAATEVKVEDSTPPPVEPEAKDKASNSPSSAEDTKAAAADLKDSASPKVDEPDAIAGTEKAIEKDLSAVNESSKSASVPAVVADDAPAASADASSLRDAQESEPRVAANAQAPENGPLTIAALTSSNKEWSERDDDASSVAGSVAASTSGRSAKGSKEKKEKKSKDVPKGGIQLGNHVIHPRKPGEPIPEWTPQQSTQSAKLKERDDNKVSRRERPYLTLDCGDPQAPACTRGW